MWSRVVYSTLVVILTLLIPVPAPAALSYEEAQDVASSARMLEREGKADEAVALVQQKLQACGSAEDARPCRSLLQFTLGALLERQAARQPAASTRLLNDAATYYSNVLSEAPNHATTLNSLAQTYQKLGETSRVEALLRQAVDAYPSDGVLGVLLGDFYRAERHLDRALDAYKSAADGDPEAEAPRRRLVELYLERQPPRFADLMEILADLEPRFPSVAEFGYRSIIERSYHAQPAMAEVSFVRWVSVLARNRRITKASLDRLPSDWTAPPVTDLRRYMETPGRAPGPMWWSERPERRHVLVQVALALGHGQLLAQNPSGAGAIWEAGIQVAPELDDYMFGSLKGQNMVTLDLLTELASLYFKYPSIDPGDRKFKAVVSRLFRSKGAAYEADDLQAIQRHHTILGTIFAQKKVWTSSHRALNGIFQLEHAVRTAERRDQHEGLYQPLPELKALLAEGKETLEDHTRARVLYLQAAQAYLDTDQLEKSSDMFGRAAPYMQRAPQPERELRAQLEQVLESRRLIETAPAERLNPVAPTYAFPRDGAHAWLFGTRLASLPEPFLARQRFKALADLSEKLSQLGHAAVAADYAAEAFKTAVDHVTYLTGAADVVRIRRIRSQATQDKVLDQKPITIDRARSQTSQQSKNWVVTIPAEPNPTYVGLSSDDLLAAKIVRELKGDPKFATDAPFSVKQGRVSIRETEKAGDLKQSLEKIQGVGAVSVIPKGP